MTQIEHITLTSALIIAVIVLWKSNDSKETLLIACVKSIAESTAKASSAVEELRKVIETSTEVTRELKETIAQLRSKNV